MKNSFESMLYDNKALALRLREALKVCEKGRDIANCQPDRGLDR